MSFINDHLLQEMVKNTTDAIVVTDTPKIDSTEGPVIVFVNDTYEKMTGYSKEEVIGKSPKILQGPETDEKELNKLREALKFEKSGHAELINYKKNGETFWTSISIFPIEGEASDIKYWVGIKRDITKRKNNQLKLAEAEQNLRHIVEINSNMFYIHDDQGSLKYVSPQSRKFLGCDPEEAKRHWTDYVSDHPINIEAKTYVKRAITTGKAQPPYEMQLRKVDGTLLWVEVKEKPLIKDGKTVEVVGSLSDITDRKRAKQNQMLLEKLTNQAWAAIWLVDSEGKYVFVNQKYKSIFGLENQKIIGKTSFEIFDRETALQFHENNQKTLISGETTEFEERISTTDGERYYKTNSFPLKLIPGYGVLVGGFAIDITELKQSRKNLEKSLREKETLLMEVNHRVKNNLAIISALLELNSFQFEDGSMNDFIKSSQLRIKSMAKIHEKLYQSNSFTHVQFKDYIQELIETIQTTITTGHDPEIKTKIKDVNLNINYAIPCGLILNELITNSWKHAFQNQEAGTIKISFYSEEGKIHLSVKDDGIGLPEGFDHENVKTLGLTLIKILSQQIEAQLSIGNTKKGFLCKLTFVQKENIKGSSSGFV